MPGVRVNNAAPRRKTSSAAGEQLSLSSAPGVLVGRLWRRFTTGERLAGHIEILCLEPLPGYFPSGVGHQVEKDIGYVGW